MPKLEQLEDILGTLEGFTVKENWDRFFTIRGSDNEFEWYAEWADLRGPLLAHLSKLQSQTQPLQILVPGCGVSNLSDHLYDAGFKAITNIDFSEVAVSDMLQRNACQRPGMKWQVMDMTTMQFEDESFDVVVDKGGLDALIEPEFGLKKGNQYLSEVNRVLKSGGKFVCFTWGFCDVLGLLFSNFQLGWKMGIYAMPLKPNCTKPNDLQTFMVVAEKETPSALHQITSTFKISHGNQRSRKMGKKEEQLAELLGTLGDFTSKENWDKFFTIRGTDDAFEWYAEWSELRNPLLSHLPPQPQILVPGCGSSRLSEHLYDAGFNSITNIDFSKVAISDCLRRNVRHRPDMRWRVMDMTAMQFEDEAFDVVVDKGGLDALMEPELGPKLGTQYLSEVRRVLKSGGKFICLTLAESHVLALIFSKFRFGWKMGIHAIPQKPSSKPSLQAFMVVAEKQVSSVLQEITSSFNDSSLALKGSQACGLLEAVEKENQIRRDYSTGSDVLYSLEELQLGARGDLTKLCPGHRFQLTLGGDSRFSYRAVVLDAQESSGPFAYHCGVFIVPKTRAHEWLFSSEEGQWMVVESSKAARLVMVLLDASHVSASMDDIQKDLSPLVKQLAPGKDDSGAQIPFMMASDGIKQRNIVHQVTSTITGPVIVEDVIYENVDGDISRILPSRDLTFRRLVFQRSEGLVQSEALLSEEGSNNKVGETERKKTNSSSKSKRRGIQRRSGETSHQLKVYHGYLASSYHTGILSGLMLISSYLESMASTQKSVKAVVIGLGAGLLPMFLHRCMPFMHTEVVELDPVVLKLAKEYFSFVEDDHLQVHIADGIQFVRNVANSAAADEISAVQEKEGAHCYTEPTSSNRSCLESHVEGKVPSKVDIVIIDVDSADSSSGMTCPAADFVQETFLQTVKDALSGKGLFIINLVSRSQAIKDTVISRMKVVFSHLFCLQLEEDVNEVIFGLCSASCIKEDSFPEAALQLEKLLKLEHPEISQSIINTTKKLRQLK